MTSEPSSRAIPAVIAGRYRVVAQLGGGGMGIVYKAIDTKLDRAVAIKAIHDRRLLERDAARRLRAEALAAASLDHPYICKVYELLEEDDETMLVMELVEGETMAALLRRGTPPLAQTLQLCREIAEGLAAAHARGLVHRDVKPSNVIITPHGHVKLLDFGLARTDTAAPAAGATRTAAAATSAYAGTPSYMAPEQAAGQPITSRADLFSLGVILFECLTGQLPFEGTSGYDYVRHLLSDNPRPLWRLAPHAPADLVRMVERCLEKTPAARIESASEIVTTLQQLSESLTRSSVDVRTVRDVRRRRHSRLIALGIAGVAAVVALAIYATRPGDLTSVLRASRPFVSWPSEEFDSRISPNGEWMSFLSTRGAVTQLFLQRLDGGDARAVTLPAGRALSQLWSPDGRELACVIVQNDRAMLNVVPAFFGGSPRLQIPIEAPTLRVRLLRWIDNAVYLQIGEPAQDLTRVDLDAGRTTSVLAPWRLEGAFRDFDIRPDGRDVVYVRSSDGRDDLWVARLDGTGATRLTDDAFFERAPLWRGDGETIVYRSNRGGQIDLWEIDPRSRRAWALTSGQAHEQPESTSADGRRLTFQQSTDDAKLWVVDIETRRTWQLTAGTLNDSAPTLSADDARVVFQRNQATSSSNVLMVDATLHVTDLAPGAIQQDARKVADGFGAVLSPDAALVAYQQRQDQTAHVTLLVSDLLTGRTVEVTRRSLLPVFSPVPIEWIEQVFAWSPDGSALYYADYAERPALKRVRPATPDAAVVLATAEPGEFIRDVRPSADGRSVAFIVWRVGPPSAAVRVVDLDTGAVRTVATLPSASVYARGWTRGDAGLVLVRVAERAEELGVSTIEILIAPRATGNLDIVGRIEHALVGTTKLDPARGVLFLTRSIDGVHNVHAYSLATRSSRQVTENTVPGVSFSGIRPTRSGGLVVVRDARVRDIWLSDIGPPEGSGR